MEEAQRLRQTGRQVAGLRRRRGEGSRQRSAVEFFGGPEPAGAPQVHRALQRTPRGGTQEAFAVFGGAFPSVLDRQGVHFRQHRQRFAVGLAGLGQQVALQEVRAAQEQAQVRRQALLHERLERLGAGVLREMHAVAVVLVAAFAMLPRHRRIVGELVEPSADQRVAALHLVVEEAERQGAVHRFYPQRKAAQLHGQRVRVHGVDAALHHMTAQHRGQARLELVLIRAAGDQLVG